VPPEVFTALELAASRGAYLNQHIRDRYPTAAPGRKQCIGALVEGSVARLAVSLSLSRVISATS